MPKFAILILLGYAFAQRGPWAEERLQNGKENRPQRLKILDKFSIFQQHFDFLPKISNFQHNFLNFNINFYF